ncbi:hypothetical protein TRFO_26763 [Tritrichomonas foetus]|uniref:BAR domain-containing protein n=1 Tax=Tritrichomonas foetus TaxID=1144522 RepID=A0A1J4K2R7_9EUKA|nr:hypothetical protein TRFO_26763 [Tritrichomonas foetus]|eukprot:OHT05491.1 hypothetical protein TRFO_26763 [Tritrichomonas foetus]
MSTIKFIIIKIELLESTFLSSSQQLKNIASVFATSLPADSPEYQAAQQRLESVKTFEKLTRNLVDHLIPKYVLEPFTSVQHELASLKEAKDNLHKLCLDMDLIKKQMTAPVTKPIVEKMKLPQNKLADISRNLETIKPDYLNSVASVKDRFENAKKSSLLALQYYEQQFLQAVEKYVVNPAARPSNPPFTDYSDLTAILPNYLQLLASKNVDDEL